MRVLVADDHGLFRGGVASLMAAVVPGAVVEGASDLPAARAALAAADFDLVLLDLTMPGMAGAQGVGDVVRAAPTTPVVVVSASENPADARTALGAGAAGYIAKSVEPERFASALRQLLATGEPCVEGVAPQRDSRLTDRQIEIVSLIRDGHSNREIARRLAITEGTVKIHVSAILRTLGARNRTEAVKRLYGNPGGV